MQTPSVWWPRCGLRVATLLSKKNVIFFFCYHRYHLPSYDQRRMHPRDYREKSGFFPSLLLYNKIIILYSYHNSQLIFYVSRNVTRTLLMYDIKNRKTIRFLKYLNFLDLFWVNNTILWHLCIRYIVFHFINDISLSLPYIMDRSYKYYFGSNTSAISRYNLQMTILSILHFYFLIML